MRLNKSTRHAIRILVDCARAGDELVKVADLSARLDITLQNVFKIVHLLSRAGLVAPSRGRYGGVKLARPATEIRIGDVVSALEANNVGGERGEDAAPGEPGNTSGVNKMLDDAVGAFVSVLNQHTLADMAAGGMADPPSEPPKKARPSRRRSGMSVSASRPPRISRSANTPRSD